MPRYSEIPSDKELAEARREKLKALSAANLSLVSNSLLILSTILASSMFGIPEYIATRIKEYCYTFTGPARIAETVAAAAVYVFGFLAIQLLNTGKYVVNGTLGLVQSKNLVSAKELNAVKSTVSMAIASCLCINVYINAQKRRDILSDGDLMPPPEPVRS